MPGFGIRTAARVLLEVGDISAFPTPGHLAAYAGPANLQALSGPLRGVIDFLDIDMDLLVAAATVSSEATKIHQSDADLAMWVADLPAEGKNALLVRAAGNPA